VLIVGLLDTRLPHSGLRGPGDRSSDYSLAGSPEAVVAEATDVPRLGDGDFDDRRSRQCDRACKPDFCWNIGTRVSRIRRSHSYIPQQEPATERFFSAGVIQELPACCVCDVP
jgi:hypothetical protein